MSKLLLTAAPFFTGKPLEAWLDSMGIKDWIINDGLVDVQRDVNLYGRLGELKRLPVRFGKVGGSFYCGENQLVSLEGGPEKVGGNFGCSSNQIVSLVGAPKEVGGHFGCGKTQLVSLEGAPEKVGGSFYCSHNLLVSLEGAPNKVGGDLDCAHNLLVDFKGLEGVSIGGTLLVTTPNKAGQDNVFVSLDGLPKELYGKVVGLDIKALLALETQYSAIPDIEI